MEYRMTIIICSFLFLIVDLVILMNSIRYRDDSYKQKIFQTFNIVTMLQQLFAVLILTADPGIWKVPHFLQYFFFVGALWTMSLSSMFWYLYLRALVTENSKLSFQRMVMLSLPIVILVIACLASPSTHWVFYIDADGVYRRGSLVFLQIVTPYFYSVLAIILCIISRKKANKDSSLKMLRFFIIFVVPSLLCVVIQMLIVPGGFTAIGISMGLILMYLELYVEEAKEHMRLKTVDLMNQRLSEVNSDQEAQLEEIKSLNAQLEDNKLQLEAQLAVIGATSQRYFCAYNFDLNSNTYHEVFTLPNMHEILGSEGDATRSLELAWRHLVIPEDQDIMREFHDITRWKDYLKDKDMYSVEYRGVTSGWSRASLYAGRRENGQVTGVVYTLEYIHEQKEAELKLASQLQEINIFAALSYEYAAVHVVDLDEETFMTIRRSPGMIRNNYDTELTPYWDTVKAMAESFVLPEMKDEFLKFLEPEVMRKRMEEEKVFTYRYGVIPDETGDYVYEMTFVNIGEDNNRHLMVLGTRCIDKLLQFEREEGQYNTALLNECEFFFSFDVTSGIITEDFIMRSNYELLQKLDIKFPISYDVFWKTRIEKQALKAKTKKESDFWTVAGLKRAFQEGKRTVSLRYHSDTLGIVWEATIILTQDMTSRRLHAVYICKDVTEMMKADLEVKQALEKAKEEAEAANKAKSSFLFNMSHDIRTPMNAIMGFRDLLEKHQEEPEMRAYYLRKIEDSSNVLLSIINNVLEMARIEKGNIEIDETAWSANQFNDTLYSIFHDMMEQKDISFTRQIEVQHPYVYCDPIKLREIFINILSNAYKYTNAGGSVTMCLKEIPSNQEGYAMYQTTITDTGIGMSENFLPHIFEEFSRESTSTDNKIEGTGLGMPIVKRLIEMMNGTIEVKTEKGVGSTFVVTIPHRIADKSILVEHVEVEIDPTLFEGKRILLAEDNDLNAEIAFEILGEAGFIVERAEDGAICYDMLLDAGANYYNLILMDIQMPNMNGYEAARAIRKMSDPEKAKIPILAMTANAFEEDKQEALRSGMNGHLAKPIDVNELMKALAGILS